MSFLARQALDTVSPVNFIATNPEVLKATLAEGGMNLVRGAMNFWADWEREVGGKPPIGAEKFRPGETVAVTPGVGRLSQPADRTDPVQADDRRRCRRSRC